MLSLKYEGNVSKYSEPLFATKKEEMFGKPLETHSTIKCNRCIAFSIRGKGFKCLQYPDLAYAKNVNKSET